MSESVFVIANIFFFVTNPIGNAPAILAMLKEFDVKTQMNILFREIVAAFLIAVFFQFFGEIFFGDLLQVKPYATSITGGVLLFLVAFEMIFPKPQGETQALKKEPFIVPIATPLLSGPGLLTIIMLYSTQEQNNFKIFLALVIAWIGVTGVLFMTPYLNRLLGRRGLVALEQLMGMLLTMMATEMIINGIKLFLKN
jgi:small neutral amino acid transporter SnatA (MarC family)